MLLQPDCEKGKLSINGKAFFSYLILYTICQWPDLKISLCQGSVTFCGNAGISHCHWICSICHCLLNKLIPTVWWGMANEEILYRKNHWDIPKNVFTRMIFCKEIFISCFCLFTNLFPHVLSFLFFDIPFIL